MTAREAEVLRLLLKGYSNLNIAARLGIREGTVKHYVNRILTKTGAASRLELIASLNE